MIGRTASTEKDSILTMMANLGQEMLIVGLL
jgi:hypothetical protein